jgi:hypothetical protein
MFVSIRQYRTQDNAEVARRVQEGFLPIVREELPGVSAYYVVEGEDGSLNTITLAETKAGVEISVRRAAGWVHDNAGELITGGPIVTNGEILVSLGAPERPRPG